MSRRRFVGLIPGLALVAAGCGGPATGPEEVKWGREYCEYCGMIIDDPRFAAQVRGGPKRRLAKFDDAGDAVLWLARQPFADDPATEFWVGDAETGTWIDGRTAWYLAGRKSPMGHNYGAYAKPREGTLSFADFRAAVLAHGSTSRCEPNQSAQLGANR
jgi:hypothetical protein